MTMLINRRKLLEMIALAPLAGLAGCATAPQDQSRRQRTLILVELAGGNDGLNTVIPYRDSLYPRLRPRLQIASDQVLQLDEQLGLNPNLKALMPYWRDRQMAVALGVGYPGPNLSHFRGIDIWNTASNSDQFLDEGWLSALYRRAVLPQNLDVHGVLLGSNRPGPFKGSRHPTVTLLRNEERMLKQATEIDPGMTHTDNRLLAHILRNRDHLKTAADRILERKIENVDLGVSFPQTNLGQQFHLAARLLAGGVQVPVIKVFRKDFDTHNNQAGLHARLLAEVADCIAAFARAMKSQGLWDQVLVMTYAEFGRRAAENESGGTDHGTAAPHFFLGGRVRGGLVGEQPPLDDLEDGNLKHRLHFRSLYTTVTERWWGQPPGFFAEKPLDVII